MNNYPLKISQKVNWSFSFRKFYNLRIEKRGCWHNYFISSWFFFIFNLDLDRFR